MQSQAAKSTQAYEVAYQGALYPVQHKTVNHRTVLFIITRDGEEVYLSKFPLSDKKKKQNTAFFDDGGRLKEETKEAMVARSRAPLFSVAATPEPKKEDKRPKLPLPVERGSWLPPRPALAPAPPKEGGRIILPVPVARQGGVTLSSPPLTSWLSPPVSAKPKISDALEWQQREEKERERKERERRDQEAKAREEKERERRNREAKAREEMERERILKRAIEEKERERLATAEMQKELTERRAREVKMQEEMERQRMLKRAMEERERLATAEMQKELTERRAREAKMQEEMERQRMLKRAIEESERERKERERVATEEMQKELRARRAREEKDMERRERESKEQYARTKKEREEQERNEKEKEREEEARAATAAVDKKRDELHTLSTEEYYKTYIDILKKERERHNLKPLTNADFAPAWNAIPKRFLKGILTDVYNEHGEKGYARFMVDLLGLFMDPQIGLCRSPNPWTLFDLARFIYKEFADIYPLLIDLSIKVIERSNPVLCQQLVDYLRTQLKPVRLTTFLLIIIDHVNHQHGTAGYVKFTTQLLRLFQNQRTGICISSKPWTHADLDAFISKEFANMYPLLFEFNMKLVEHASYEICEGLIELLQRIIKNQ